MNDEAPTIFCGQCGEHFVNENQCSKHMESHLFKRYKCEYTCESKENLAQHENSKHNLLSNNKNNEMEQQQTQRKDSQENYEHEGRLHTEKENKLKNACNQCTEHFVSSEGLASFFNEQTKSNTKC